MHLICSMVFRKTGETKQIGIIEPKTSDSTKPSEKTAQASGSATGETEAEKRLRLLKSNAIGR